MRNRLTDKYTVMTFLITGRTGSERKSHSGGQRNCCHANTNAHIITYTPCNHVKSETIQVLYPNWANSTGSVKFMTKDGKMENNKSTGSVLILR